jgi:peptidoglycan/LPS O-acetylase OafA/YrhL
MMRQGKKETLWYLDNLKIFLTILVIVHHVGQGYGRGGWWYFSSEEKIGWLKLLFLLNRSFFMSLFFMISGFFLARSLAQGSDLKKFLTERLRRFGIPLVLFGFGVFPVLLFMFHHQVGSALPGNFIQYYVRFYLGIGGVKPENWSGASWPDLQLGHLWFIEHLLLLSIIIAVLHRMGIIVFSRCKPAGRMWMGVMLVVLAITTIVVRHFSPIDRWVGLLGFIQVAYADVPRDLFFFFLGLHAYRSALFETQAREPWKKYLGVSLVLASLYAFLLFTPSLQNATLRSSWWSVVFPFWETVYCYSMCMGLVSLFRERASHTNWVLKPLGKASYGAYLVHVPVVVILQYVIRGVGIGVTGQFFLVAVLSVAGSYGLTHIWAEIISDVAGLRIQKQNSDGNSDEKRVLVKLEK